MGDLIEALRSEQQRLTKYGHRVSGIIGRAADRIEQLERELKEVRAKQAKESYREGFCLGHEFGCEAPKEEIERINKTHSSINMLNQHREHLARAYSEKHAQQILNGGER